jgi:hypothetical protein
MTPNSRKGRGMFELFVTTLELEIGRFRLYNPVTPAQKAPKGLENLPLRHFDSFLWQQTQVTTNESVFSLMMWREK